MFVGGNKCIYLLLVILFRARLVRNESSDDKIDKGTELLDKEYGVRYASECEGRYNMSSLMMSYP